MSKIITIPLVTNIREVAQQMAVKPQLNTLKNITRQRM
jgi:hypothetical protein